MKFAAPDAVAFKCNQDVRIIIRRTRPRGDTEMAGVQMKARFVGGAYDGLELDHDEVNRYGDPWWVPGEPGRLYVFMPPPDQWDGILAGTISPAREELPNGRHAYERVVTPG